jgi:hypothetical protein
VRVESVRHFPTLPKRFDAAVLPNPCIFTGLMRYLVKARVGPGREKDLINAIDDRSLGRRSVAGDEYLRDMKHARLDSD